jgi:hypothetical protein
MIISSKPRIRVWLLGLFAAVMVALSAAPAAAQSNAKERAKALYQQGKTQFDLGNFDESVKLFKQAYSTSPNPAFLFNIAQAYRQMGDCKQALFFYKRYLTVAGDNARDKDLVEGHIKQLGETCKASEEMKDKPPLGAMPPGEGGAGNEGDEGQSGKDPRPRVVTAGDDDDDDDDYDDEGVGTAITLTGERKDPTLITSVAEVGAAFLDFGDLQVTGAQLSLVLGAGYPLHFGKIGISVGGLFTYTPVPWNNGELSGNSPLLGVLANVGVRYRAMDKLGVGGDLGVGALFVGGLSDGNVFLPTDSTADGLLPMFNFRVGVSAEYLITDNLAVNVSPFSFSMSPAHSSFRMGIDSLNRIEMVVGVGYQR